MLVVILVFQSFKTFATFSLNIWGNLTGIQGRSHNLRHFYPGIWLKLGFSGFSHNQNNCGSSGAYVTVVWAWRQTCVKCHMARKDHGCICFVFIFACMVGKNPKNSNLSPWLMTSLHEVWDFPCISVGYPRKFKGGIWIWFLLFKKNLWLQNIYECCQSSMYHQITHLWCNSGHLDLLFLMPTISYLIRDASWGREIFFRFTDSWWSGIATWWEFQGFS